MRFTEEEYTYRYPANLEEKPLVMFWTHNDIIVILLGGLAAFFILVLLGSIVPMAAMIMFAILKIQTTGDTRTLWQYINDAMTFAFNPRIWCYIPGDNSDEILIDDQSSSRVKASRRRKVTPDKEDTIKDKKKKTKKQVVKIADQEDRERKERIKKISNKRKQKMTEKSDSSDGSKNNVLRTILLVFLSVVLLILIGYSWIMPYVDKYFVNHNENIQINYMDNTDLAWYSGTVDPIDYVKNANGKVTADPATIDTTVLGKVSVVYTVTDSNGNTKQFTRDYNVVDKDLPIITLNSDHVIIAKDQEYDPKTNISSIVDKIDGDLEYSEDAKFQSYTISTDLDTSVSGDYTVDVSAIDSNGNEATESFTVTVE